MHHAGVIFNGSMSSVYIVKSVGHFQGYLFYHNN